MIKTKFPFVFLTFITRLSISYLHNLHSHSRIDSFCNAILFDAHALGPKLDENRKEVSDPPSNHRLIIQFLCDFVSGERSVVQLLHNLSLRVAGP